MDKEYLLTYREIKGNFNFEWFDTKDEIMDRAEELKDIAIDIEAIHVKVIEKLI